MSYRKIKSIVNSKQMLEGGGFPVKRPFPNMRVREFDPFLLLDHMGPVDWAPGKAIGAPEHPHRGFETVTYLLEGAMEHRDSWGNSGKLGPGDVQWMTAGSGLMHSELPDKEFAEKGGRMNGFQLWVNLPSHLKMVEPKYQDTPSHKIPEVWTQDSGAKTRVIAGEAFGQKGVIDTRIPITYFHATLEPGVSETFPIRDGDTAIVYLISGQGIFSEEEKSAGASQLVEFEDVGDELLIRAGEEEPLSVLILGGEKIGEPISRYGPFVMNTEEEIQQTIQDFQNGKMGRI